ncbi:reverse transcriptase domain-containing protein [Tanacetum coccineum]
MDRFKSESSHIKEVPPVLRIPDFMHGHGHPEIAKKLNDKIHKTMDEMFERVRAFIRWEVAAGSAEMVRPSQGDKGNARPVWSGVQERARNRNGPRDTQRNMGMFTSYPRRDTFTPLTKTPKEILAMESISNKKFSSGTPKDDGEGTSRSKRMKRGSILGGNSYKKQNEYNLIQDVEETLSKLRRVNIKIDPNASTFRIDEGKFLGHMVTKDGVRADPEKVQAIIRSSVPKNVSQIRSLFLQLSAIDKFVPKLAELKHPIRKVQMKLEAEEGSDETISSLLLMEREGIQIPISYVSRPLQGMEVSYTSMEKTIQALIHTERSLRTIFRKHKIKVITKGPMEEILKLSEGRGRLAKWATEIRTYDISYVSRKDPEGPLVKKSLGQGEHGLGTSGASREETILVGKELEPNLTPKPKACRLYIGKDAVEEGSGIGMILVSPDETIPPYAIRLNFKASEHSRDCEALLAGLVASAGQGIKDLHVFIDSPTLAAQMEGSYAPAMRQERKYKEEIMDATAPFHRFRITHLPKILNPKAEVLTGLATIKLESLN